LAVTARLFRTYLSKGLVKLAISFTRSAHVKLRARDGFAIRLSINSPLLIAK
jgi:hypothetical protein